jgi:hypothetical protein
LHEIHDLIAIKNDSHCNVRKASFERRGFRSAVAGLALMACQLLGMFYSASMRGSWTIKRPKTRPTAAHSEPQWRRKMPNLGSMRSK